ncbi:hypothetical protein J6590_089664 [Homalodisca vitripennis]|nr:hypothetical protein J6590_089664 [Homalodisca vitripennis]
MQQLNIDRVLARVLRVDMKPASSPAHAHDYRTDYDKLHPLLVCVDWADRIADLITHQIGDTNCPVRTEKRYFRINLSHFR